MVVASIFAFSFAIAIFFFLPIHPSEVGIEIEELTQNEMLIQSALENKKVFEKIVTNPTGEANSKAELAEEVARTPEYN